VTLLEVCVDSTAGLQRAQAGGARRIELCSRLDLGGLSPTPELLEAARERTKLPLHVMVRPRAGDFVYDAGELATMRTEIADLKELQVAAVVLGVLQSDRTIDLERVRELVQLARPLRVTFHRAFDDTPDLDAALDHLIALGVERVLTSGGAATAWDGRETLARLVAARAQLARARPHHRRARDPQLDGVLDGRVLTETTEAGAAACDTGP
jgi:copper homeostasis protein